MGRQPLESDLTGGIVFLTICNIVVYGVTVYGALLMLSLIKRKPSEAELRRPPKALSLAN
jgi:hypothetical protein